MQDGWSILTADDVAQDLSGPELASIQRRDNNQDKLPGIVDELIASIRGSVAQRNRLGPAGMVPNSLRHNITHMAIAHYLRTVTGGLLTESRLEAEKKAEDRMQQIEEGKYKVELPDGTYLGGAAFELVKNTQHVCSSEFNMTGTT